MKPKISETLRIGPAFDPGAVRARLGADLGRIAPAPESAPVASLVAAAGAVDARRAVRATRRAERALADAVGAAIESGAVVPPLRQAAARAWRLEQVDPGGDHAPAWVVRFGGQSAIAQLARTPADGSPPVLDELHVDAARRLVALHQRCVHPPKLTASYEGAGGGRGEGRPWVDVHCDAYAALRVGLGGLLPAERVVVLEAAVYETPIHALAAQGLAPWRKAIRAEAGVCMTLRSGLERLATIWELDRGPPVL